MGTLGSKARRCGLSAAIALILPDLMSGVDATTVSTASCTCPPISAVRLGELPLKGTCIIGKPAVVLSISAPKCTDEPVP